jgi:hypothetical protein
MEMELVKSELAASKIDISNYRLQLKQVEDEPEILGFKRFDRAL